MEGAFYNCRKTVAKLPEVLLLTAVVILNHHPFSLTFLLRSPLPAHIPLALYTLPHSDVKNGHFFLALTSY